MPQDLGLSLPLRISCLPKAGGNALNILMGQMLGKALRILLHK